MKYPMFLMSMCDLIDNFGIPKGGAISGRWKVIKRGSNYGITLVELM